MPTPPQAIELARLIQASPPESARERRVAGISRYRWETASGEIICDQDSHSDARCLFLRSDSDVDSPPVFRLPLPSSMAPCTAGGWLLRTETKGILWLPQPPSWHRLTPKCQIQAEKEIHLDGFELGAQAELQLAQVPGHLLDSTAWQLGDETARDLEELDPIEGRGYFLWGSHTRFERPADTYRHLHHGWIYEDRACWPFFRRICSENDAHALYTILSGLHRHTGKAIYDILRRQVLASVLDRQAGDGGWHHGEWTEDFESHFRLHTSALHLLMDAFEEFGDEALRRPLEQGFRFLAERSDLLRGDTWFLHDALELDITAAYKGPFTWAHSSAFGKSPSNMLVLNTHLDTLVAFDRYQSLSGDRSWESMIASARRSLRRVLLARPAEVLYRLLFSAINLHFLPKDEAQNLALPLRAWKRVGWKYFVPILHRVKARYPRLVMPGGYIDRALALKGLAAPYLAINLMDLARYLRRFPEDENWLMPLLEAAFERVVSHGMRRRWEEEERTRYALGFWAEALYHLCLHDRANRRYRAWLADAMLRCEATGLGQAPSLLGTNGEAVGNASSHPLPSLPKQELLIADLGEGYQGELLVVNPLEYPVRFSLATCPGAIRAKDASGQPLATDIEVPPTEWIHLTWTVKA